jgi:hypothetical protein
MDPSPGGTAECWTSEYFCRALRLSNLRLSEENQGQRPLQVTSNMSSPNSKRVRFQLRMHPKQRGFDSTQITGFDYDLAVESRFST